MLYANGSKQQSLVSFYLMAFHTFEFICMAKHYKGLQGRKNKDLCFIFAHKRLISLKFQALICEHFSFAKIIQQPNSCGICEMCCHWSKWKDHSKSSLKKKKKTTIRPMPDETHLKVAVYWQKKHCLYTPIQDIQNVPSGWNVWWVWGRAKLPAWPPGAASRCQKELSKLR